ncbi:MAG: hypothetical protein Q8Q60_01915 [Candidatus Chromulinivorax sp.]|nr:hypothetical protein [Candidatus Chromulinivorax sp.]
MNMYKKTKISLFFILSVLITQLDAKYPLSDSLASDQLDSMIDFAYPVSIMESVRQDLNRALYFLRQNDLESVPFLLQDALAKLASRQVVSDDDRDHIQNLIDQINAIIYNLEHKDKSGIILDLCQQIQDKL